MPYVQSVILAKKIPSRNITLYKQMLNNFDKVLESLKENLNRKILADLSFKYRFERDKFEKNYKNIKPIHFREDLKVFLEKLNDRIKRYREYRDDISSVRDDLNYYRKVLLVI